MSGICERGFMLMLKKFGILGALSELLEPHLFGRTGDLKFGAIGVRSKMRSKMQSKMGNGKCLESSKKRPLLDMSKEHSC